MKLTAIVLAALLLIPSSLLAESPAGMPIREAADCAVAREAAVMAQAGTESGSGRNPYLIPGLVMVGAGTLVAIAAAQVPKLKTQTDGYDKCAQANGVATGPSNYDPVCGAFLETNTTLQRVGIGVAAAGLATITISSVMKSISIYTPPSGGFAVKKTGSF